MNASRHILAGTIATVIMASSHALAASPDNGPDSRHDYFFGDSDLEQGNYQVLAQTSGSGNSPYACGPVLCRDSNGPNWAEYLSPAVVPVLAATPPFESLNFAVSGAHMTDLGDPALAEPTGVGRQVDWFSLMQDAGTIQVGARDRFFLHAGTNDMLRLLDGESPEIVRTDIVAAASDHVRVLAARGARTIVVAKVQPVQYLPFLNGDDYAPLRQLAGDFVAATNTDLSAAMVTLRPTLAPGTRLVMVDQNAFFLHLRSDYHGLGFTNFDNACYDEVTGDLCASSLDQQNRYVFFDGNHFTTAAHALLADWYNATLFAASGNAAEGSGRMVDALFAADERTLGSGEAVRQAMAHGGDQAFSYAAPIVGTARLETRRSGRTLLSQNGVIFGFQVPLNHQAIAALSLAYLDQDVRHAKDTTFSTRGWSASGTFGARLGSGYLTAVATYARDTISNFKRDTGALGLTAKGETHGDRYGISAEFKASDTDRWRTATVLARLRYQAVKIDGFREGAATGLELDYGRQTASSLFLDTEAKITLNLAARSDKVQATPFMVVRNRMTLAGGTHQITSTLLGDLADPATIRLQTAERAGLSLGCGADARLGPQVRVGFVYDHFLTGGNRRSGTASAYIAMRF